jgi:hypothetical protein
VSEIRSINPSCDDEEWDEGGLFNNTEFCPCDGTTNLQTTTQNLIGRNIEVCEFKVFCISNLLVLNVAEYKLTYPSFYLLQPSCHCIGLQQDNIRISLHSNKAKINLPNHEFPEKAKS